MVSAGEGKERKGKRGLAKRGALLHSKGGNVTAEEMLL